MAEAITETRIRNLGRAITSLGLEDKFLADGALSDFTLLERAEIANEIISEKLNFGRWESVVQMIWGGLGKADALYDGNKDTLKKGILESAKKQTELKSESSDSCAKSIETLAKKGEYDFIFNLMTSMPNLGYDDFIKMCQYLPATHFEGDEGAQRKDTLGKVAGEKAMRERKYDSALINFEQVGNEDAIEEIFNEVIKPETKSSRDYSRVGILEEIAMRGDHEKREERLRKMFSGYIAGELEMEVVKAFNLFKPIPLSEGERAALYDAVAKKVSIFELKPRESEFHGGKREAKIQDSELALLWARKHAEKDPDDAYSIFLEQGYTGEEVLTAVVTGITLNERGREKHSNGLDLEDIKPEHLREVYAVLPFNLQIRVSQHLKDKTELARLSQVAKTQGDFRNAYDLWVSAGNGFEGEYMDSLRQTLIRKEIEENLKENFGRPSFYFLDGLDSRGHTQAFDALMEVAQGERRDIFLSAAHDLAYKHDSEGRLERVRQEMVSLDLNWALRIFKREKYMSGTETKKMSDPVGFDYALGIVAEKTGVKKEQLSPLIEKYLD